MTPTQETVLSVPDISCEHCVKTINETLGGLAGVEAVETDLPTKTVHLRYNAQQVSLDKIAAVLDEAGYSVVASSEMSS
jgi:copper chaperone